MGVVRIFARALSAAITVFLAIYLFFGFLGGAFISTMFISQVGFLAIFLMFFMESLWYRF